MIEVSGQTFYFLENSSRAVYEPKKSFTRVSPFLNVSVVHDYDLLHPYFTFYGEREHNLFDLGTQAGAFDNIERARSLKDF